MGVKKRLVREDQSLGGDQDRCTDRVQGGYLDVGPNPNCLTQSSVASFTANT